MRKCCSMCGKNEIWLECTSTSTEDIIKIPFQEFEHVTTENGCNDAISNHLQNECSVLDDSTSFNEIFPTNNGTSNRCKDINIRKSAVKNNKDYDTTEHWMDLNQKNIYQLF